jgi:uncharacterized protein (TIGR02996 family)
MTEEMHRAFMKDIKENLYDDTPRLIYADYCEDQGDDDRAVFIRTQILMHHGKKTLQCAACLDRERGVSAPRYADLGMRLAGRPMSCTCSPKWKEMTEASGRLLAEHREEWGARYCPVLNLKFNPRGSPKEDSVFITTWRRGFPCEVWCQWDDWRRLGGSLVRDLPLEIVTPANCEVYQTTRGMNQGIDSSLVGKWRLYLPTDMAFDLESRRLTKNLVMYHDTKDDALKALTKAVIGYVCSD